MLFVSSLVRKELKSFLIVILSLLKNLNLFIQPIRKIRKNKKVYFKRIKLRVQIFGNRPISSGLTKPDKLILLMGEPNQHLYMYHKDTRMYHNTQPSTYLMYYINVALLERRHYIFIRVLESAYGGCILFAGSRLRSPKISSSLGLFVPRDCKLLY